MKIDNLLWWLLILLNFASYFTYSYGQMLNIGYVIQFVGGAFFILSFVAMFIFFGIWSGIILILLAFILVAPIVGLLIARIGKKLYGHYEEIESIQSSIPLQNDEKNERLLKALKKGMLKQHQQNHPELQKSEQTESLKHSEWAEKFLRGLNKGMVKEHMKHKHLHPELQKYSSYEDWLKAKYPNELPKK